jgi:hypothetical protein
MKKCQLHILVLNLISDFFGKKTNWNSENSIGIRFVKWETYSKLRKEIKNI